MKKISQKIIFFLAILLFTLPAYAIDLRSAASSLNAEKKDINDLKEVQRVERLLDKLEKAWNEHDIEQVTKFYAEDFINGDGLNLEAVTNLTKELWEAYPDIKTVSQERTIRVDGDYIAVNSTDIYHGTSNNVREEVGTKGVLRAVAIGETFFKKYGPSWKITSDKTIYEKVSIGYGIGTELIEKNQIKLSAPEQIISNKQYTASLDFDLPNDIKPVASISKELLVYPQVTAEDKFRLVDMSSLERLFTANMISKNELVTATVGLTGGTIQPTLLGLVFLSKRVNVIPVLDQTSEISIIKEPAKSALYEGEDEIEEETINKSKEAKLKTGKEMDDE